MSAIAVGCIEIDILLSVSVGVTLFDADKEIGGQFNIAKQIPGKEEFYEKELLRTEERKYNDRGDLILSRYFDEEGSVKEFKYAYEYFD